MVRLRSLPGAGKGAWKVAIGEGWPETAGIIAEDMQAMSIRDPVEVFGEKRSWDHAIFR